MEREPRSAGAPRPAALPGRRRNVLSRLYLWAGIWGHLVLLTAAIWMFAGGCPGVAPADPTTRTDRYSVAALPHGLDALRPLQEPLAPPMPGDWLAQHHEPGQTYEQWRGSDPVRAAGKRTVLYIQPIGTFSPEQRRIVELSAEYMRRYFSTPVKFLPDLPLERIPAEARRHHPSWGMEQVLTHYVLQEVLYPALPADALASIAFTSSDLWPGRGWNFVYGMASLRERVGVWSIYRNGDPAEGPEAFRTCLLRTIKTATHETGHMLSIQHCIAYECNMCGCNHRAESDRKPLHCCPECVAKICDATGADPVARYRTLAAFCREHRLAGPAARFERFIEALQPPK